MRVLIVDDHAIVRAGLRRLLAEEPDIDIREAAAGREALSAVREHRPDIVVLDLNMPGIGGLEVIARLKAEHAALRILVLTMHDDVIYVTRALQAGAAGYVSKNASPDQILEAVRRDADVRVQQQPVTPAGTGHRHVGPCGESAVALECQHPSARQLALQERAAVVGRGVVDGDHLCPAGLDGGTDRAQAAGQSLR